WIAKMKVKRGVLGSGKEFKTFMKYNRPYVKHYVVMTVISGVRAALFALEPLYLALIIDKVIIGGQSALLPGLVLSTILAVMGVGLLTFAESFMNSYVAEWQTRDIRSDYFKSLEEKSFAFFDSNAVGDLVSRATMDLQAVNNFAGNWPTSVTDTVFVIAACLLVMIPINPVLTLLTLVHMPLIMSLQFSQFTQVRPLFMKMMLILGKLGAYIQQNIIGMKNVRIFEKETEMKEGFK